MSDLSLQEAKALLADNLDEGMRCPCCSQYARRYRRKFNSTMSRSLLWLVNHWSESGVAWVDVPRNAPRWLVRSNQLPTVRWWGLLQRAPSDDPKVKHSGLWAPTQAGIDFALGRTHIPSYATTYGGEVLWLDGQLSTIYETLGRHFDYEEIMNYQGYIPEPKPQQQSLWIPCE